MNKFYLVIGVAVILVLIVGGIVFMNSSNKFLSNSNNKGLTTSGSNTYDDDEYGDNLNNNIDVGSDSSSRIIVLEELSIHNTEDDCWLIYKDKVYDLSSWIDKHPGGVDKISPHCGKESFEAAFTKKHGTSKASFFMNVAKYIGDIEQVGEIA